MNARLSLTVTLALLSLSACVDTDSDSVEVCLAASPEDTVAVGADTAVDLLDGDGGWLPAEACAAASTPGGTARSDASGADEDSGDSGDSGDTITLSGNAFVFGSPALRLPYATVTISEVPGAYAVTNTAGAWSIADLPADTALTPIITFPNALYAYVGLPPFQTMAQQTFKSDEDVDLIFFQSVPQSTYAGLAALAGISIDPAACQVATTVAVAEMADVTSLDDYFSPHGFEGAEAWMTPASAAPDPVYFNDSVRPDASLSETSGDGGVLWGNVPAGRTYKLHARDTAAGADFKANLIDCQAGRFINASPPRSLIAE
jgi:hypothetical protein